MSAETLSLAAHGQATGEMGDPVHCPLDHSPILESHLQPCRYRPNSFRKHCRRGLWVFQENGKLPQCCGQPTQNCYLRSQLLNCIHFLAFLLSTALRVVALCWSDETCSHSSEISDSTHRQHSKNESGQPETKV